MRDNQVIQVIISNLASLAREVFPDGVLSTRRKAPDTGQGIALCIEPATEEDHRPTLERHRQLDLHDIIFTFGPRPSDHEASSVRPGVRLKFVHPIGGVEDKRHH